MKETTPQASASIAMRPASEESPSFLVKLWRGLTHPFLLGILLILAGGVMAAHLWLPQLPTALANDPLAAAAWLDAAAASAPGGAVFRALGLFDLAHNLALRLLLPLLAAVLLAHLAGTVWRAWAARRLEPPDRWLPGLVAWDATLAPAPEQAVWFDACTDICGSPRIAELAGEEDVAGVCDCHPRQQWLGLAWELGLLLALAALLLNLYSGWQIDPIVLDPGQSVSLAPYATKDVSLSEDTAQITLCCPQATALVAQGGVSADGVAVKVVATGRAVQAALLRDGRPLQLQAIEENARVARQLVVHFPEARSERAIAAPEAGLAFRLVALDDGGVRVQALNADNQTLFSHDVYEASALPLGDDLTLQLKPTSYVQLRALGRPWTWLLRPAGLLILIGLMAIWRWPYWRLGVRANEAGAAIRWQGARRTKAQFQQWLSYLRNTEDAEVSSRTQRKD
ncbi:MAG TPA: hypothetical protein ENK30_01285 [Anaerolineae bacterium]|nr:hypothetical protein [Anaerolineae bacterium]